MVNNWYIPCHPKIELHFSSLHVCNYSKITVNFDLITCVLVYNTSYIVKTSSWNPFFFLFKGYKCSTYLFEWKKLILWIEHWSMLVVMRFRESIFQEKWMHEWLDTLEREATLKWLISMEIYCCSIWLNKLSFWIGLRWLPYHLIYIVLKLIVIAIFILYLSPLEKEFCVKIKKNIQIF